MSKENAVVLPVALLLYDWYFLDGRSKGVRKLLTRTLPFFVIPVFFAGYYLFYPMLNGIGVTTLATTEPIMSLRNLTPLTYFVTEFSVVWTYIRIFFAPYGITLDFCYPVVGKVLTLRTIAAASGLAGLVVLAWRLRQKCPRISFGIFWFFLTLSVESSFIPLDPLFIHRLYLPMIGIVIVVLDILDRIPWRRGVLAALCAVICVYGVITWQRNMLWRDPVAFYEDNLRKAPQSERVRVVLSEAYQKQGRNKDARRMLLEAMEINRTYSQAIDALARLDIIEGNDSEALILLEQGVQANPQSKELHTVMGALYSKLGRYAEAELSLQRAIALDPLFGRAHSNLGVLYARQERLSDAVNEYRLALKVLPDDPWVIRYNLGINLIKLGRLSEARIELKKPLLAESIDATAVYNLARMWLQIGERQEANFTLARLRQINANLAEKLAYEMRLDK
jgi:Flp pilus assembly protein TadD